MPRSKNVRRLSKEGYLIQQKNKTSISTKFEQVVKKTLKNIKIIILIKEKKKEWYGKL